MRRSDPTQAACTDHPHSPAARPERPALVSIMKLVTVSLAVLIVVLQHPLWLGKGSWLRVWESDQKLRLSVK